MFLRFFPAEKALSTDIAMILASRVASPAALQGHFLAHRHNALAAVRTLPQLVGGSAGVESESGESKKGPMPIGLWLKRLALPQRYGDTLRRMNVQFVVDLRQLPVGDVMDILDIKVTHI